MKNVLKVHSPLAPDESVKLMPPKKAGEHVRCAGINRYRLGNEEENKKVIRLDNVLTLCYNNS